MIEHMFERVKRHLGGGAEQTTRSEAKCFRPWAPPSGHTDDGTVDGTGLTTTEAAHRLDEVGPNEIEQRGRISVWSSIGGQLRDPLIAVLLAACALTLLTSDFTDAAVIAFVVVVNTAVGVTQEMKADRAITALAQLSAPMVRVRRDDAETSVPVGELVPGDVVLLGEGDIVPADCELLEASSLLVDESALTGESVAVGKGGPHRDSAGDGLSSGTVIVKGRAVGVVTGTGASSALGQIAALMDTPGPADTSATSPGRAGEDPGVDRGRPERGRARPRAGPGRAGRADGGHRDQPRGRRGARVVAGRRHLRPGTGGPADGRAQRRGAPAPGCGDAGIGDRAGHRQDRHPDRGPDVGRGAVDP